ncbi:MAG: hypothetical protein ACXW5W_09305 [Candidatus Binatia bacterium]
MPFKDPDPTDPNMLVGVMLSADAEATRDMAYVFAEEFARLGYTREQLLWLFKNPFYGGAHGAYRALGENETQSIIDECLNVWGTIRITVQDVQTVQTDQTPSSIPRVAGEEGNRRSEPLKRFERSEAIDRHERFERFEPSRREERDDD